MCKPCYSINVGSISSLESREVSEEVVFKNVVFELSPIHFTVKYEGKYYTNVEFTNEIRYILGRLELGRYIFEFSMFDIESRGYKVVLKHALKVGIMSRFQALDLSNRFAESVYRTNKYDRTKSVSLRLGTCI